MKRASTLDSKDRQAAARHAGAARADTGNRNEENGAKADTEAAPNPPLKKIKLSSRKDSSTVESLTHAKGTVRGLASPASPLRGEAVDAQQGTATRNAAPCSPKASAPALHGADGTRLATTGTMAHVPVSADICLNDRSGLCQEDAVPHPPAASGDNRRRQWQERDQPSFMFDEITDPLLLTLFDSGMQTSAPPTAIAQPSERERRQQLQPVAHAIRKALEGVLADMTRKFMNMGKRDGIAKLELQEAHHAFSEMVQMFNRAKVAAADGHEAKMLAELGVICPAMDEFLRLRMKSAVRHFSAEKEEAEALRSGLRALLAQCRAWLHGASEETVRPWSPSSAPTSPEARQRAVSSPVKPSELWAQTESDTTDRLAARLSGNISPRASQHRIAPASPSATLPTSPTSRPLSNSLSSPVTSPVLASLPADSPKESTRSFRISSLLASPLSPRSREGGRKDASSRNQARQASLSDSPSRLSFPTLRADPSATPETAPADKNSKHSS